MNNDLEGGVYILDKVKPGNYKVVDFMGGYKFKQKLSDMGIYPGTVIKVISSAPFGGPVRIIVKGAQYALGRGMASKIYVKKM